MSDLQRWLEEGKQKWELIEQHGEVGFPWRNPWYRFALLAVIGLGLSAAGYFWLERTVVWIIGLILGVPALITAARFYVRGARVGGIAGFISTDGCAIGCGHDRLFVPWSAVNDQHEQLPINDQYMLIPLKDDSLGELKIERQDGTSEPWNREPYKRAIIRAEYVAGEGLRIYAYPNEIIVFYLTFLYPILGYRHYERKRRDEGGG